MKRPAFQFYPGDWQANSNLRRCTHAEKGAWIDVMCLLHDGEEYGQLRWPLKEIAQAIGVPVVLLRGLVAKGVLKGNDERVSEPFIYTPRSGGKDGEPVTLVPLQDGPLWYSSRMVKDEYVRINRGKGTRFGDDIGDAPKLSPNHSPKPPFGEDFGEQKRSPNHSPKPPPTRREGDGSSSSSSSSKEEIPPIPPTPDGAGGKAAKPSAIGLPAWLALVKAEGAKAIPKDDPVFAYAEDAGLPVEFVRLAWREFRVRYSEPGSKRYKDWRRVFRKAVRGNWFRLWRATGDGGYALTTTGTQAQRVDEKEAA
ncbi:MAG: hypothetical protein LBI48_02130 [Burkholderiaceae bacterium]|jgi:hypothetical protein|nr:hypothetical protein [Burkholderiaceae bacterium]